MAEEAQSSLGLSFTLDDAQAVHTEHSARPASPSVVATEAADADAELDLALSVPLLDDADEDLAWDTDTYEDGDEEPGADDSAAGGPVGAAAVEACPAAASHLAAPPSTPAVAIPPSRGLATRGVNARALAAVVLAHLSKKVIAVEVVSRGAYPCKDARVSTDVEEQTSGER